MEGRKSSLRRMLEKGVVGAAAFLGVESTTPAMADSVKKPDAAHIEKAEASVMVELSTEDREKFREVTKELSAYIDTQYPDWKGDLKKFTAVALINELSEGPRQDAKHISLEDALSFKEARQSFVARSKAEILELLKSRIDDQAKALQESFDHKRAD